MEVLVRRGEAYLEQLGLFMLLGQRVKGIHNSEMTLKQASNELQASLGFTEKQTLTNNIKSNS